MPNPALNPGNLPVPETSETTGPNTAWLCAGFLLAGLGTVLLGPLLPTLSATWHLSDALAGSLLFAKFLGSFAGGSTVPRRLRLGVLTATLYTAVGLAGFAAASRLSYGFWPAAFALLITGFGLGRLIASSNILAGRRYATHTGSALATLNFFWSLGAVGTGLLIAWLLPRFRLPSLLFSVAAAFLLTGFGGASSWLSRPTPAASASPDESRRLDRPTLLLFIGLFILYGGLETTLSSWLPTFDGRYIARPLLHGQSALVLFWTSLTIGRALAAAALRRWREALVLRATMAAAVLLILALTTLRGSAPLSLTCILLGLSLAPWFPATFAILLHRQPAAREAGFLLATSAIGAAVFPWLTGIVSTHTGSLRWGMTLPAVLAFVLLLASFRPNPISVARP